jgi:amino acid transporter
LARVFVLTGHVAATNAGPAIALSFVLGGIACAFAGLCYAEMAAPERPSSTFRLGVLALRISQPDIERPFRAPAIYFVAPAGALSGRLGAWLLFGLVIYFFYGMRHSRVANQTT